MMIVNVSPRTRGVRFYNPSFDRWLNEFFRTELPTNNGTTQSNPAVNVLESADHFKIEIAAPGFDKTDFQVSTEKNVLTISAKKEAEGDTANGTLRRKEFSYKEFKRTFRLPDTVNAEAIEAAYNNGILTVTLPKVVETPTVKKIDIA